MKGEILAFILLFIKASNGQIPILVDPLEFLIPSTARSDSLCERHLKLLQDNLANPFAGVLTSDLFWPQLMADATGKVTDGLTNLNIKALGNAEECISIDVSNPGNGTGPFMGRYISFAGLSVEQGNQKARIARLFNLEAPQEKMAALVAPSGLLSKDLITFFGVGVCVPDSCSEEQVKTILEENYKAKQNATLRLRYRPSMTKNMEPVEFDWLDGVMIGFFAILAFLIVTGTVIESYQFYRSRKNDTFENGNWIKFFMGFGVCNNTLRWLNTDIPKSADHLGCLDGIRFISMTWVVLGHAWGKTFDIPLKNVGTGALKSATESFWIQAIINAFPSVDSFFLISGVLLSYLTLKELDKQKGRINIPLFYIHRYLRLTGTYVVIIGFYASLLRHLKFGPMFEMDFDSNGCREGWWKNLLYINNFGSGNGENFASCIGQTWYLANDFQMFIFSPLFIWPLWKFPKIGMALSGVAAAISVIVPTALTVVNEWPATVITPTKSTTYFEWNYVKPWCRYSPYIIGLILGYILHITKRKEFKINPLVNLWLWAIAFVTGCAVIYGLDVRLIPIREYSPFENAFYGGFHRAAWALALSWMIFACCRGYGGWINQFLSWPAFIPLSRISYIIYLLHFFVIGMMQSVQTHMVDGTNTYMTIYFLDVLVFSALISAFVNVLIEMPWLNTEKLIFSILLGKPKSKSKSNQVTNQANEQNDVGKIEAE